VTDEFRVDVVVEDHLQRVVVHGEVDLATAQQIEAAFCERVAGGPSADGTDGLPVVVDLSRCDFIDSSGVRTVVMLGQQVAGDGRRFSILCPPTAGSRFTLDLIGVGTSFPVLDTLDDLDVGPGAAESA
jgi:anti-anti-sigma factor